ncbi:MAG: hydrolase [Herbinix sp.]|jgi:8-oxo-dGTP pyrophosphatase MutT (NUDIX family)|nr:hydrolase [Herbinix sp.]
MDRYKILVKGIVQYEDKYLVVRRWYDDRLLEPYQWGFIDGTMDFKEPPDKAVLRCINEQTGLSATMERILYTWTFTTGDVFNIGISYLCRVTFDDLILSEELTDANWIVKEELENYIERRVLDDIEEAEL